MARQLKRILLAAVIAVLTVNVWTGAPLLALWVGSRVQTNSQATMLGIAVVAAVLALTAFVLIRLLGIVSATYDRVSGTAGTGVRTHAPWLRTAARVLRRPAGRRSAHDAIRASRLVQQRPQRRANVAREAARVVDRVQPGVRLGVHHRALDQLAPPSLASRRRKRDRDRS